MSNIHKRKKNGIRGESERVGQQNGPFHSHTAAKGTLGSYSFCLVREQDRRDIPGRTRNSCSALYYFYIHLFWRDYSARLGQTNSLNLVYCCVCCFTTIIAGRQAKLKTYPTDTQTHTSVERNEQEKRESMKTTTVAPALSPRHRFTQNLLLPLPSC